MLFIRLFFILIMLVFAISTFAQVPSHRKATEGFFDFNYYRDTREFNEMTINLLATAGRLQYFSLTNLQSEIEAENKTDKTLFYTEQNIRWYLSENGILAFSTQAAMQSGERNDIARAGVLVNFDQLSTLKSFFKRMHTRFAVNLFPLQLDRLKGYNSQIEYIYNIQIAPSYTQKRLYLSGFADQNIGPSKTDWVTEHQLGYRFFDNFFLVVEYRLNEFKSKKTGTGIGLEYLLPF